MSKKSVVDYVNPNIGTIGHLLTATRPNVSTPHGAAIITPIFTPGTMDVYTSQKIYGFSAGCGVIMPTENNDSNNFLENASTFDHDLEIVKPHIYSVFLEDYNVTENHTAYENTGVFAFDYNNDDTNKQIKIYVRNCTDYKIDGDKIYVAHKSRNATMYTMYEIENQMGITVADILIEQGYDPTKKDDAKIFVINANKTQIVKFVISYIGFDKCDETYNLKLSSKRFEDLSKLCFDKWDEMLSKIEVTTDNEDHKTVFYTAYYRSVGRMHNYSENGEYFGYDGEIHTDTESDFYCDDGIWDTYRCMHPLQLLLEPKTNKDVLNSYLRMYKESGWLPRFPYMGANVPCMLGHHGVSILADALAKGVEFDVELAYEAAHKNATKRTMRPWMDGYANHLDEIYYEKGFFPALRDDEDETCEAVHPFEGRQAVAVTLEHAYDDFCVAKLAEHLGKDEDAKYFYNRSKNYQNLFNKETKFMHPKNENGEFLADFDPKLSGGQGGRKYFAENNSWTYTFHVQHDIEGLIELFGGEKEFEDRLDNLFTEQYSVPKYYYLKQFPDATGLIGQYCQGNEPSFHIPYLYNYVGKPHKTQRKIHEIINLWYTNHPCGICGDEDGGAMSSWLVFSAMGFYPVTPGTNKYDLGSPIFDKVVIHLDNGNDFIINANGAANKEKYVMDKKLNGKDIDRLYITHDEIISGGTLDLTMVSHPLCK